MRGRAPTLVIDIAGYGFRYAGICPLGENDMHIRIYHFILPFPQIRPAQSDDGFPTDAGHIRVPMDDENTIV